VSTDSLLETEWAEPGSPIPSSRVLLWIGLAVFLVAELVTLTLPFHPPGTLTEKGFWAGVLFAGQRGIRPTVITAGTVTIFLSWPVLHQEFRRVLNESPNQIISVRWLAAHLILLSLLIFGTRAPGIHLTSMVAWEGGLFLWSLLACGALLTWLFSALPPRFWVRWFGQSRLAFLAAGAAGLVAYAIGNWTQELWWLLQRSTFQMVTAILRMSGQAAVNRPDELVIGTSRFAVRITAHCSGLEGVGLICSFTGVYLWTCRRELRFPQALVLLPIGAISAWVLNTMRIAALIFIGGWSQDTALKGFHSAAGWIFFNFVAVAMVWTSSRAQLFDKKPDSQVSTNPASGYILPLIVFFASSLIASLFSSGSEYLMSAVAVPVLYSLWYCRATLFSVPWKPSWLSILAGGMVFAEVLAMSNHSSADASIGAALHHLPMPIAAASLLLGFAGGAIAIPAAQELAFRGYLARKLVAADFENVPFNQFTWLAFLGSSIVSGAAGANWFSGILAGMIFALVMYRRGMLSDAILAHAFSSALLFLFASATGKWSLLS
jgi:exosortase E/protease (VPEID-CTERM system)